MYAVVYTNQFEKTFRRLDRSTQQRVLIKIKWLAAHPEFLNDFVAQVPPELEGLRKYRVGDWRLLFWVDHNEQTLTLYLVDHRRAVYKHL